MGFPAKSLQNTQNPLKLIPQTLPKTMHSLFGRLVVAFAVE
jgi:hypothetical protein